MHLKLEDIKPLVNYITGTILFGGGEHIYIWHAGRKAFREGGGSGVKEGDRQTKGGCLCFFPGAYS